MDLRDAIVILYPIEENFIGEKLTSGQKGIKSRKIRRKKTESRKTR